MKLIKVMKIDDSGNEVGSMFINIDKLLCIMPCACGFMLQMDSKYNTIILISKGCFYDKFNKIIS